MASRELAEAQALSGMVLGSTVTLKQRGVTTGRDHLTASRRAPTVS